MGDHQHHRQIAAFDLGTKTGVATHAGAGETARIQVEQWDLQPKRHEGAGMRGLRFRKLLMRLLGEGGAWEEVVFEEVRRHKGVAAAHVYGGLMNILTSVCEELSIPYRSIPVGTIKRHVAGLGSAGKEAVAHAISERWPNVKHRTDNESDALAILACAIDDVGI